MLALQYRSGTTGESLGLNPSAGEQHLPGSDRHGEPCVGLKRGSFPSIRVLRPYESGSIRSDYLDE